MTTQVTSVKDAAEAILAAMPALDATDQQIATAIHRLISRGEPVELETIGKAVGIRADQVDARLNSWPGVFRDGNGRLLGFWGHAIGKLDP